ncbi:murein hydrolase activator EnvC family protein, partial [candidate division KSB1 bacterium]
SKRKNLQRRKEGIKNNRELHLAELSKKEASQRRLLNIFTNLGKSRPEAPILPPTKGASFAALKGMLIWPARGTIISHYGVAYNKALRTRKNNLGIDIKASFGSDVYSVAYGIVRMPQWLPGYGPILIIEHDDGYITSYAHLSEILVEIGQIISAGQVIAKVGEAESFEGPKLNFQLWQGGTNLNPEMWLSKGRIYSVNY